MEHHPDYVVRLTPAELDELKKASTEVDRGLLRLSLGRSPCERLRVATRAQKALSKFHRHAST